MTYVLREVGQAVGKTLEGVEDMTLSRYQGQKFAFLLPGLETRRARRLAQRVQRAVNDNIYDWEHDRHFVSARVAIVPVGEDTESAEAALEAAAAACDAALDGGDGIVVIDPSSQSRVRPMMDWVTLINRTLGEDRIQLRCQLVRPMGGSDKPLYEVLLGVKGEDDAAIDASEFVAALEYLSLIHISEPTRPC